MIIFLHGLDTFRSKEKLSQLKQRFSREVDKSGLNLMELDAKNCTIGDVNKAIFTQSFLAKKRMVVIKNSCQQIKSFQNQLLDILKQGKWEAKSGSDNILIFWDDKADKRSSLYKYLSQSKFRQEFNILTGLDLTNWALARFKAKQARISQQGAGVLCSRSDGNLWALAGEIDKLCALKKGSEITVEDIEQTNLVKIDDNIFNLTDAVGAGNKNIALKLINDQLESGTDEIYLLAMIVRQFRILIQIKTAIDRGMNNKSMIAKELGMHPFVVQKTMAQAGRYSIDKLKQIYDKLLQVDIGLKSSSGQGKVLLEKLVLEV